MVPTSIGAVVRIAAVCLCLGALVGSVIGWHFFAADSPDAAPVETVTQEIESEEEAEPNEGSPQPPPPPVDVELA